jgi:ATP-dependent DNA helicase RecQ
MPPARHAEIPAKLVERIHELVTEGHEALAAPRQLARFLCGLASPATSRTRPALTRHRLFGALADTPFAEVLAFCASSLLPLPRPHGKHSP